MRDHAVAAESVILLVDISHDLTVWDRVVSVLHVSAVALVKAIPEQGDHRPSDRLLVIGALAQLLQLAVVLPGDHAQRNHAELLHPVFLDDLPHGLPVHRHSPSLLYQHPGAAAVVIRQHRPPGTVVAIVHQALRPCAVVVVPDR